MPNFLEFAERKLREREPIYSWGEEKFSEEELASKSKTPDPSEVRLDLFEVTKILQNDLDRQIISLDSGLREYYDFYKALDDDKASYQQQYVGAGKGDKQNELRNKTREFFEQIKARYPENIAAIRLLEEDLTKKIDANIDVQVAMAIPYLMLQTITYFDQIDKIQDGEKKRHFLSQFPMSTKEEYACVGGFSARLNPILMMLNAENVHLNSAHQSAVSSSNLNRGDSVHQQAMMNALFGINLKDEHYLLPAGRFTAQELWQGYLDYHAKLQEQFLLQQEQVKQDVIGLAKLFDESDRGDFSKKLKENFFLKDADFYEYDEDLMPSIDDKKVKAELEKRAKNYYPKGIDLPIILQGGAAEIKDFNAHKTSKVIRNILHNGELSQSEKNVALNYLWIRAVKEINDSNTKSVLPKLTEEDLQLLIENKTDEEIKSFFEQKEQQSLATLEQIASFDNSILSQNKLVLIKDKLVFEKVLCKQDLLLFTARNDYIEVLQALLKDDQIDVNHATQNGATALMFAAQNGHLELVTKLLEAEGIDVNKNDQNGDTALTFAAQDGHLEVVTKLLKVAGIDVNRATQDGFTALMIAAQNGHLEVVTKLLDTEGIDVHAKKNGFTALKIAAINGRSEVVDKIFKKLCMDGTDPRDIAYIQADRPKIFSDADKISSFADKIFSFIQPFYFIKPEFGFSTTAENKLITLVRKSLFREIFADENVQNVDTIINHFAQQGAVENIANTIAARLRSFDGVIKPSKSRLSLIPFNNPKTLNLEHEGIEALVRDPIKELINQVLAPDPSSVYGRSGVSLKSTERGDGGVNRI